MFYSKDLFTKLFFLLFIILMECLPIYAGGKKESPFDEVNKLIQEKDFSQALAKLVQIQTEYPEYTEKVQKYIDKIQVEMNKNQGSIENLVKYIEKASLEDAKDKFREIKNTKGADNNPVISFVLTPVENQLVELENKLNYDKFIEQGNAFLVEKEFARAYEKFNQALNIYINYQPLKDFEEKLIPVQEKVRQDFIRVSNELAQQNIFDFSINDLISKENIAMDQLKEIQNRIQNFQGTVNQFQDGFEKNLTSINTGLSIHADDIMLKRAYAFYDRLYFIFTRKKMHLNNQLITAYLNVGSGMLRQAEASEKEAFSSQTEYTQVLNLHDQIGSIRNSIKEVLEMYYEKQWWALDKEQPLYTYLAARDQFELFSQTQLFFGQVDYFYWKIFYRQANVLYDKAKMEQEKKLLIASLEYLDSALKKVEQRPKIENSINFSFNLTKNANNKDPVPAEYLQKFERDVTEYEKMHQDIVDFQVLVAKDHNLAQDAKSAGINVFNQAVGLLNANQFDRSVEIFDQAKVTFLKSLELEEDKEVRRYYDRITEYKESISQRMFEANVAKIRDLIKKGAREYYLENYRQAEVFLADANKINEEVLSTKNEEIEHYLELIQAALNLKRDETLNPHEPNYNDIMEYYNLASSYLKKKNYDKAMVYIEKALQLKPYNPDIRKLKYSILQFDQPDLYREQIARLKSEAKNLYNQGDFKGALLKFNEIEDMQPEDKENNSNIRKTKIKLGMIKIPPTAAEKNKARALVKEANSLYNTRLQENYEKALAKLQQAKITWPEVPGITTIENRLLVLTRKAVKELKPENEILYKQALILYNTNDFNQALKILDRITEKEFEKVIKLKNRINARLNQT